MRRLVTLCAVALAIGCSSSSGPGSTSYGVSASVLRDSLYQSGARELWINVQSDGPQDGSVTIVATARGCFSQLGAGACSTYDTVTVKAYNAGMDWWPAAGNDTVYACSTNGTSCSPKAAVLTCQNRGC
jgi:hypothetical protein